MSLETMKHPRTVLRNCGQVLETSLMSVPFPYTSEAGTAYMNTLFGTGELGLTIADGALSAE